MKITSAFFLIFSMTATAMAESEMPCTDNFVPYCQGQADHQLQRSKELQDIVNADQADRTQEDPSQIDWSVIGPRDEARRKRVGEIYGEGCINSAADYAAAALVYQHGIIPDHYFQTFLWAKRAVELGDASQSRLMEMGIDRYLVQSGKRQLFGTQLGKPSLDPKACWCMEELEVSFPELRRKRSRANAEAYLNRLNAGNNSCAPSLMCEKPLKPSPAGTVPGFW